MYDAQARQDLEDKLGYELKLLDFLYGEAELGHNEGGTLVLGDNGNRVEVTAADTIGGGRARAILERLDALVFVASYKLLDMQFEWILEEHEEDGIVSGVPDKLGRKITQWNDLEANGDLQPPPFYSQNPDIRERMFALYEKLRDYRNAVIHRDDFEIENETFRITDRNGSTYRFDREQLFALARAGTISSHALISDGLSEEKERFLKTYLDLVDFVHGKGDYDVAPPWAGTVEITVSPSDESGWIVDLEYVWDEFESTTPAASGFFLHVIGERDGDIVAEWRIPSEELDSSEVIQLTEGDDEWSQYRTDPC